MSLLYERIQNSKRLEYLKRPSSVMTNLPCEECGTGPKAKFLKQERRYLVGGFHLCFDCWRDELARAEGRPTRQPKTGKLDMVSRSEAQYHGWTPKKG